MERAIRQTRNLSDACIGRLLVVIRSQGGRLYHSDATRQLMYAAKHWRDKRMALRREARTLPPSMLIAFAKMPHSNS